MKNELNKANHERAEADKIRNKNSNTLDTLFKESAIRGEPLSDTQLSDIRASFTDTTFVVEEKGQKFRATEFQKFISDFNNDFEEQLYLFKIKKYRDEELNNIQVKAESNLRKDFMGRMPIEIEVDKGVPKSKIVNNKFKFGSKLYESTK